MTRPPNPITQGIKAVWRDPALFLVEILWRWSFVIVACLLIASAGAMLLGPLHIGNAWDSASQSRDPQKMGQLTLVILLLLGVKAIVAAIAFRFDCVAVEHFFRAGTLCHRKAVADRTHLTALPQHIGATALAWLH